MSVNQCSLRVFALAVGALLPAVATAAPPSDYTLAEVSIEFAESAAPGETHRILLSGAGTGSSATTSLITPVVPREFTLDPSEVFHLLESCYGHYFFEMPGSYGLPDRPSLDAEGTVHVLTTVRTESPWRTITVRIGSYSRSVGWLEPPEGAPPPFVDELRNAILRLAQAAQTASPAPHAQAPAK